ncbi:hypothetical protein B0G84_2079 [Paraburkholderia sp. BL8N3]|jgi:hypothetical protein|nr:hypothetical protein [Paraburkholderia sp. BL8N3]TCK43737.1 hypothetical protein B0G84_2079 [Paraburkholderia sp. BL8N3]
MYRPFMITLFAVFTAACETTQQTASLECGAAGLGVAFLLCKAAGGSNATCAAVGGVAAVGGGVLCYSLSDKLDKRRKELAGHENDLDARLRYVKGINADTAKYNEDLKKQVAALSQHTDTLVQQIQQKTADEKKLADQRKALDAAIKNASDSVAAQRNALNFMRSYQAEQAGKSQDLAAEVQRQQMLLAETQRETSALAAQRQRI